MRRLAAYVLLAGLVLPGTATALPVIHAHRGGALVEGVPKTPEDTLEAFRVLAATPEVWLEMDSVVSSDGVPYVIHDSTLDRTTNCAGNVLDTPAAVIDRCEVDVVGVSQTLRPPDPGAPIVRVPRLADALALARASGSPVNLEIKRIPGDPGYTPGDTAFAEAVMAVVAAAGLDPAKLIIQSFDPTNLDVAKAALPGVVTSLLTLAPSNEGAPEFAAARGYEWVSPGGVPSPAFMARARALGLMTVPYTLNSADEVLAAAAVGVDALITDDPTLARRVLAAPAPPATPPVAAPPAPVTTAPPTTPPASPRRARRTPASPVVSFARRSPANAVRRGGLPVTLTAGRPASASVSARLGSVLVAAGNVVIRGAGRRTVLLRLTPTGRRALRGRRSATLRATVVFNGRAATTQTVRLR